MVVIQKDLNIVFDVYSDNIKSEDIEVQPIKRKIIKYKYIIDELDDLRIVDNLFFK